MTAWIFIEKRKHNFPTLDRSTILANVNFLQEKFNKMDEGCFGYDPSKRKVPIWNLKYYLLKSDNRSFSDPSTSRDSSVKYFRRTFIISSIWSSAVSSEGSDFDAESLLDGPRLEHGELLSANCGEHPAVAAPSVVQMLWSPWWLAEAVLSSDDPRFEATTQRLFEELDNPWFPVWNVQKIYSTWYS